MNFRCQKTACILLTLAFTSIINHVCASASEKLQDTHDQSSYEVKIEGLANTPFENELKSHLSIIKLQSSPLVSSLVLKKRIQKDTEIIKRFFASKGYFEASASFDIRKDPLIITLKVETGPQYRFNEWIFYTHRKDQTHPLPLPTIKEGKVEEGKIVKLQKVLDFKALILKKLSENGYPFAKIPKLAGHLNRDTKTLTVKVTIDSGEHTVFGETQIRAFRNLDSTYIQNRLQWREGESFSTQKVEETRSLLTQTRLFSDLEIVYDEESVHKGAAPILINAKEAKPRTISLGAKYSSSERLGAQASWHHRNIFGKGEVFKSNIDYGSLESKATFDLIMPDFFNYQRSLLFSGEIKRKRTKSYNVAQANVGVGFEQIIDKKNKFSQGIGLLVQKTKQKDTTLSSSLITLPLGYGYDSTDDLTNPKKGERVNLSTTPAFGKLGRYNSLVTTKIYGSIYRPLDERGRNILAGWARVGMLFGPSLESTPADMRLYAGGNSSVRGYGYQMLGPLDADGTPTGGKTSLETGIEYRIHIKKDWGAVAFLEGGKVLSALQSSDFLSGAGIGVRYETRFGVLRGDIALPLKRRKNTTGKTIDAPFQIYASIGQAF
jgi:translocation and assembly module TamA